ncbi:carboxypeptidase regulatory-like domain-containing protein [Pseudomonas sp. MPFS]|uniref:carboxypeptidase regulatory-like domain-containing protein n=1 Tax=Pseudomonas sp. MPFS TaxID=2795724 RepID=UPI001F1467BD|nr:carboxypeptidase regulatory-like domain-containing protein [Pseudomonas sp. MPFS]UMZ12482.1 carboxypeptidase regulatory-like domain-containing protein [Pseudomonas sp. MPFS]
MKCSSIGVMSALAVLLLALASPSALGAVASSEPIDPAGVQLVPQQQNGIAYLSGGIGLDESRAIQQVRGYNLHLTFSVGPQNQYTSDVDVAIENAQGHSLLNLAGVGPIVYVQLPPGKFQVVTTRKGLERRSTIDVAASARRDLNVHWDSF